MRENANLQKDRMERDVCPQGLAEGIEGCSVGEDRIVGEIYFAECLALA